MILCVLSGLFSVNAEFGKVSDSVVLEFYSVIVTFCPFERRVRWREGGECVFANLYVFR